MRNFENPYILANEILKNNMSDEVYRLGIEFCEMARFMYVLQNLDFIAGKDKDGNDLDIDWTQDERLEQVLEFANDTLGGWFDEYGVKNVKTLKQKHKIFKKKFLDFVKTREIKKDF